MTYYAVSLEKYGQHHWFQGAYTEQVVATRVPAIAEERRTRVFLEELAQQLGQLTDKVYWAPEAWSKVSNTVKQIETNEEKRFGVGYTLVSNLCWWTQAYDIQQLITQVKEGLTKINPAALFSPSEGFRRELIANLPAELRNNVGKQSFTAQYCWSIPEADAQRTPLSQAHCGRAYDRFDCPFTLDFDADGQRVKLNSGMAADSYTFLLRSLLKNRHHLNQETASLGTIRYVP